MHRPSRFLLVLVSAAFLVPGAALAGNQPNAKVALHVQPHVNKVCSNDPVTLGIPLSDFQTEAGLHASMDVYLVVAQFDPGPGIAGVSCGIDYDAAPGSGVDMFGWTRCADLGFPNSGPNGPWPAAGGGNRITWNYQTNCQRTVLGDDGGHAVAGAFYVYAYSPDIMRVTQNRNLMSGPELTVGSCAAVETELPVDHVGSVTFSDTGLAGCNPGLAPCDGALPAERTTWSGLKALYPAGK